MRVTLLIMCLFFALSRVVLSQVFWSQPFTLGADFNTKTGAWSSATNFSAEGYLAISANNASNGTAEISMTTTNLTAKWPELHLAASLRLGQANTAQYVRIGLRSTNGAKILWEVPLTNFTKGRFKTHLVPVSATPVVHDAAFDLAQVNRVLVEAVPQPATTIDWHLERISLADIPALGTLRIVGPAHPSDPPSGVYYSTIQSAINASRPRDVVLVQPGTYNESVQLTKDYASHETRLVIMASRRGAVILNGGAELNASNNYVGLEYGFNWSVTGKPAIRANHIEIVGFVVRDYVGGGMGNRDGGKITIRHCVIHSNGSSGVSVNYPQPDTRIKLYGNLVFLNGWGESWAGGIHLNNKETRLNSITRDASGNSLPEDDDYGHEVIGNLSFLNLDESQYNSDGNGIMLDFAGGSEALVSDNIVFFNAGAGLRNLNGRTIFQRNIVYRNGWDHRGTATNDPPTNRSNNEQIGFLLKHDTALFTGNLTQFLDFTHGEFVRSRLINNLVWTASRFNLAGPYFQYTTEDNRNRSLSQFAMEAGLWSLFRGDNPAPETSPPTGHVARQAANGHKLPSPGGNLITDDQYLMANSSNSSQLLYPQLQQTNLHSFFAPDDHPFEKLPGVNYDPPAYAHIYGQALRNSSGAIISLTENTTSIGMVWNPSVKKNISSKHAQVATPGNRPPLDLNEFNFAYRTDASAQFLATAPQIGFDPDYASIFLSYLASEFPLSQPPSALPFAWSSQAYSVTGSARPLLHRADHLGWLQAENFYSSSLHNSTALDPRWQLVMHDNSRFGTPYLHAETVYTLSQLNQTTSLRFPFNLSQAGAPLIVVCLQTPVMPNLNNDSFFIRVSDASGNNPLTLPLNAVRQNPPPNNPTIPRLTDTSTNGWYRFFVDHSVHDVMLASLQLPELTAGNYEIQLQPRQGDVLLDRIGVFTNLGSTNGHHVASSSFPQLVFDDWVRAKLPTALSSQPAYQDPLGDPLGIGRQNLLAYSTNISPDDPITSLPITQEIVTSGGNSYNALRFVRAPGRSDLTFVIEVSADLVNWTSGSSAAQLVESTTLSDGSVEQVVRDLINLESSSKRFIRLKVSKN